MAVRCILPYALVFITKNYGNIFLTTSVRQIPDLMERYSCLALTTIECVEISDSASHPCNITLARYNGGNGTYSTIRDHVITTIPRHNLFSHIPHVAYCLGNILVKALVEAVFA